VLNPGAAQEDRATWITFGAESAHEVRSLVQDLTWGRGCLTRLSVAATAVTGDGALFNVES